MPHSWSQILIYGWASHLGLWQAPGYYPLWIIQRITLLAFWISTVFAAMLVFQPHYYDPEWLASLK